MSNFKHLLGQNAFWMVNKFIARHFGDNNTALLLSELIDKHAYHEARGELKRSGGKEWFFITKDQIEESLNIKYKFQMVAVKNLKEAGIIETKNMGIPAKRYFTLNHKNLAKFIS